VPYVIRMVSASTAGLDWNQKMAARNLGASAPRAFLEIVLPQIAHGVIAGGLFAMLVSFDDVGIAIFPSGATYTTLPVELFAFASYNLTQLV
jgi:putative spermidine/putrescine transport system permease protein